MITVALVGASTGLGRTVLKTFISYPHKHKIVVLSRTAQPDLTSRGVEVRCPDYKDPYSLEACLQGVHTVLSFIGGGNDDRTDPQLNLIKAARAAGVKRLAPSEYAGLNNEGIDMYAAKDVVWNALRQSGLEYTRFACGLFLNILGNGTPKPPTGGSLYGSGQDEAHAGLRPWDYVINMRAGTADLAGDGNAKMALTETHDIGRFVLAALDLETWPDILTMRGDYKSFNELVAIVERVQGRTFLIKQNTVESMQREADTVPSKRFYNQTRIQISKGWLDFEGELNKLFPNIKPTTAEEYVAKWWQGVEPGVPSWGEDTTFGAKSDFQRPDGASK